MMRPLKLRRDLTEVLKEKDDEIKRLHSLNKGLLEKVDQHTEEIKRLQKEIDNLLS